MFDLLIAATLVAVPAPPAPAQDSPPQRIRNVFLQPGEQCPKPASPDEIVVCPPADAEQFRIPKQFREEPKQTAPNTSWAVKADRVMDDNQRVLPGSCSPVGSNGHTGCAQQAAEAWAAEERARANGVVEPR